MKQGANFQDRNKIKLAYAEGLTPEEISDKLLIDVKVIRNFKPKKEEPDKSDKPAHPVTGK